MFVPRARLHRPVTLEAARLARLGPTLAAIRAPQPSSAAAAAAAAATPSVTIPITTVSEAENFDAFVNVSFAGATAGSATTPLLIDSGNSMLVVPRWEDIAALPGSGTAYRVLGPATEPWGCPVNVVCGPVDLITADGTGLRIDGCVFFACTGDGPDGGRTANFGAGCLRPWSADPWGTPAGLGVTLRSPLSYRADYPFAVFDYAPAETVHAKGRDPKCAGGSALTLCRTLPEGFAMFEIVPNVEWMSLTPRSLAIGSIRTGWPGGTPSPLLAMVDTGGGPVFLSDPNGYLYDRPWPEPATNPGWTSDTAPPSKSCRSVRGAITVEIGDASGSYAYTIDPSAFPASARGLTLVMCEENHYMMGRQGMNIGGISALANRIVVDYRDCRVGFGH